VLPEHFSGLRSYSLQIASCRTSKLRSEHADHTSRAVVRCRNWKDAVLLFGIALQTADQDHMQDGLELPGGNIVLDLLSS